MTTEWARWLSASIVLALVGLSCAAGVSNRVGDTLDVSAYPPEIRDAYKVFALRCSRCHTLARPLNARIDDPQQWVRYVARMRLNPASGINAKNGEIILSFLLYYMEQRKLEQEQESDSIEPSQRDLSPKQVPPAAADGAVSSDGPVVEPNPSMKGDSNEVRMPEPQPSVPEAD